MSKSKRMFYLRDENIDFYDNLENKSEWLNEAMKLAREGGVVDLKVEDAGETTEAPNPRAGLETYDAVEAMRKRDLDRLKVYRDKKGLYNPTEG